MRRRLPALPLLALFAVAACGPADPPLPGSTEEPPEALEAAAARREVRQSGECLPDLPPGAAEAVEGVRSAAAAGNAAALRPWLAEDVHWSFGGDPGAGRAIEHWRQDPAALRELAAAIERGCVVKDGPPAAGEDLVVCPPEYEAEPHYLGYRVGFGRRGEVWKMIFFVAGD